MKKVIVGKWGVWNTLEECAAATGLSASTVHRKMYDGSGDFRYLDRIFMVRLKDSGWWTLAVMDGRGQKWLRVGRVGDVQVLRKSEVAEAKDVTLSFYCGTEFEGVCRV